MKPIVMIAGLLALGSCTGAPVPDITGQIAPSTVEVSRGEGPPDADPDACYGQETTPAVIETVTEQILLQSPRTDSAGQAFGPAVYVTEIRQQIVDERRVLWFATPCQLEAQEPEFVRSLQRALAARGLYRGAPSGVMDARTHRAIRAFQAPRGLNSPILSMEAARQMGLVIWDPVAAAGDEAG